MRHRRRVDEAQQHQNEIEACIVQRAIMLRRLCSDKRVWRTFRSLPRQLRTAVAEYLRRPCSICDREKEKRYT